MWNTRYDRSTGPGRRLRAQGGLWPISTIVCRRWLGSIRCARCSKFVRPTLETSSTNRWFAFQVDGSTDSPRIESRLPSWTIRVVNEWKLERDSRSAVVGYAKNWTKNKRFFLASRFSCLCVRLYSTRVHLYSGLITRKVKGYLKRSLLIVILPLRERHPNMTRVSHRLHFYIAEKMYNPANATIPLILPDGCTKKREFR